MSEVSQGEQTYVKLQDELLTLSAKLRSLIGWFDHTVPQVLAPLDEAARALDEARDAAIFEAGQQVCRRPEDYEDSIDDARLFLASIASAESQGTQGQTDWMIAQAREGLRRAGGYDFDSESRS